MYEWGGGGGTPMPTTLVPLNSSVRACTPSLPQPYRGRSHWVAALAVAALAEVAAKLGPVSPESTHSL